MLSHELKDLFYVWTNSYIHSNERASRNAAVIIYLRVQFMDSLRDNSYFRQKDHCDTSLLQQEYFAPQNREINSFIREAAVFGFSEWVMQMRDDLVTYFGVWLLLPKR